MYSGVECICPFVHYNNGQASSVHNVLCTPYVTFQHRMNPNIHARFKDIPFSFEASMNHFETEFKE